MSVPPPRVDRPRYDSAPERFRNRMADGTCRVAAWNRERLIEQFQRIDGSSRSEAEQQILVFEQSFRGRSEISPK